MGAGTCWTLVAPTRGVGMGTQMGCILADLTLGAGTGNGRTAVVPTRGAGMDAVTGRASAGLETGAQKGRGAGSENADSLTIGFKPFSPRLTVFKVLGLTVLE